MYYIRNNIRILDKVQEVCNPDEEKVLNSEILQMTMTIKDYYPELVGFLEEMPGTISDGRNLEITLKQLKIYSESLNSFLTRYILEHSISSK